MLEVKLHLGFPGASDTKRICLQCGRPVFSPWVGKIPWRRVWQPTLASGLENPYGQRSLAGCSSWGHKESDSTERLSTAHSYTPLKLHMFSTFCVPALSISSVFGCRNILRHLANPLQHFSSVCISGISEYFLIQL